MVNTEQDVDSQKQAPNVIDKSNNLPNAKTSENIIEPALAADRAIASIIEKNTVGRDASQQEASLPEVQRVSAQNAAEHAARVQPIAEDRQRIIERNAASRPIAQIAETRAARQTEMQPELPPISAVDRAILDAKLREASFEGADTSEAELGWSWLPDAEITIDREAGDFEAVLSEQASVIDILANQAAVAAEAITNDVSDVALTNPDIESAWGETALSLDSESLMAAFSDIEKLAVESDTAIRDESSFIVDVVLLEEARAKVDAVFEAVFEEDSELYSAAETMLEPDGQLNEDELSGAQVELVGNEPRITRRPNVVSEEYYEQDVEVTAEALGTFRQLVALMENDTPEPAAVVAGEVSLRQSERAVKSLPTTKFKEYVAAQPMPEKPLALGEIQIQANDQPLEETLVQLAECLSDTSEMADQTELAEMLDGIQVELTNRYHTLESGETKLHLTPEFTEKLLALLRAVGYQDPGEVLLQFVAKNDLEYLLQAIEYLCQLNHEANRKEFLKVIALPLADEDSLSHKHLGKKLLGLITGRQQLELAA